MMSPPLVSVCIANYQGLDVIETCLASIFSQECDFDFEVIVYDDASNDGSASLVRETFPQALLLVGNENVGYCTANWRMVQAAKGRFLLLFNNDAWLMPGSLQALANAATQAITPVILGLPQYDAVSGILEDRGRLCDPFLNAVPNLDPERQDVAMVAGACLWLPRQMWFELGGFPEWFVYTAEDLYLCSAARLRGYGVKVINDSVGFYHHIGHSIGGGAVRGGALSTTSSRRFHTERNKCAVMLACFPSPWHLLGFSVLVVTLLIEGLILMALKKEVRLVSEIYIPALTSVWKRRKKIMEMRRLIQKNVVPHARFFSQFTLFPYKLTLLMRYGVPEIK